MYIGIFKFTIHIPGSHSLKEKRRVVRSLCQKLRNTFTVSVAEVSDNDVWQTATIGISFVSNSVQIIQQVLSQILSYLQQHAGEYMLAEHKQEIISGF